MKIYIDLSVLVLNGQAVGRVSGVLELAAVPPLGSSVILAHSPKAVLAVPVAGFTGTLQVTDVRFEPETSEVSVALSLEDVVVSSLEDGLHVMRFLEEGFGLSADEYNH